MGGNSPIPPIFNIGLIFTQVMICMDGRMSRYSDHFDTVTEIVTVNPL